MLGALYSAIRLTQVLCLWSQLREKRYHDLQTDYKKDLIFSCLKISLPNSNLSLGISSALNTMLNFYYLQYAILEYLKKTNVSFPGGTMK